jgi:hypothetical protein
MALTLGQAAATRSQVTINYDSLHTFANEYVLPLVYDNFYKKQKLINIIRQKNGFEPWAKSTIDRVRVMTAGNNQVQAYTRGMKLTAVEAEVATSAIYELVFYRNAIKFYEGDLERTESANQAVSKFKIDMAATMGSLADKVYKDMIFGRISGSEFAQETYTDVNSVSQKGVVPLSVWGRVAQDAAPITDGIDAVGHIDPAAVTDWRFVNAVADTTTATNPDNLFARNITTYKQLVNAINDMITEICYHGVNEEDIVIICDPVTYNIIRANEADKIRYMVTGETEAFMMPFSTLLFNGRIPMVYDHEVPDIKNTLRGRDRTKGTIMFLTPGKSFTYAERVERSQYLDSGTFSQGVIDQLEQKIGMSALEKYPYMPFYTRKFQSPDDERQAHASEVTYGIGLRMYKPRANGVLYGIPLNI